MQIKHFKDFRDLRLYKQSCVHETFIVLLGILALFKNSTGKHYAIKFRSLFYNNQIYKSHLWSRYWQIVWRRKVGYSYYIICNDTPKQSDS